MAIKIGHASISEKSSITGTAGDQTKKEVCTRGWYKHSKGWRAFRAKDSAVAEKIAKCMEMACANDNIGYDQHQRNTLYNEAKQYNFDVSKVTKPVETDCSALVRVCCAYAGVMIDNFRTPTEPSYLLKSGAFIELTDSKYTTDDDYLKRGDILCTKTQGHTLVILENGSKSDSPITPAKKYALGSRLLKNGCEGDDVKELQSYLIQLGYNLGKWGADGDFGDATEIAVRKFQTDRKIDVDGIVGKETIAALERVLKDKVVANPQYVKIVNGNCYVRTTPNTEGKILGTAKKGTKLVYKNQISENGWHFVEFNNKEGWVSGKYSDLVK